MHVLITGGSGFIGRALTRALLGRGDRVTVLSRTPDAARAVLAESCDVIDNLALVAPDAVVNLAGESLGAHRWNERRQREFVESRAGTTRRLVEWMRGLPRRPGVLISGSAVGYYGARGDEALAEDAKPGDEYQSDLCARWEAEALAAEPLGVRVCRIRIGIVLAGDGGALAQMRLPFLLGLGGHLGSGRQWMSWIHRDDLVALILWLMADPSRSGAYNATSPNPSTNRAFARALAGALHRPALLPMPAPIVRLLIGGMAHLLLTGQRVVPARALREGFAFRYPDLAPALAAALGATARG